MAQAQRKQAGWKHEIDRIAGGDFDLFMRRHKALAKALAVSVKRWRIAAVVFGVWAVVATVLVVM